MGTWVRIWPGSLCHHTITVLSNKCKTPHKLYIFDFMVHKEKQSNFNWILILSVTLWLTRNYKGHIQTYEDMAVWPKQKLVFPQCCGFILLAGPPERGTWLFYDGMGRYNWTGVAVNCWPCLLIYLERPPCIMRLIHVWWCPLDTDAAVSARLVPRLTAGEDHFSKPVLSSDLMPRCQPGQHQIYIGYSLNIQNT